MTRPSAVRSRTSTSRSAASYGSGRSRTVSRTVNAVVVAPTPSASVRSASAVKPGCLRSDRTAHSRSCTRPSGKRCPQSVDTGSLRTVALPRTFKRLWPFDLLAAHADSSHRTRPSRRSSRATRSSSSRRPHSRSGSSTIFVAMQAREPSWLSRWTSALPARTGSDERRTGTRPGQAAWGRSRSSRSRRLRWPQCSPLRSTSLRSARRVCR